MYEANFARMAELNAAIQAAAAAGAVAAGVLGDEGRAAAFVAAEEQATEAQAVVDTSAAIGVAATAQCLASQDAIVADGAL